ncbi:MAG: lycopene cyclase domain-containing protein [Nitrospiraceae bacterium]|nr:lycopene cyclase domain-containing protein [Nitrospiraceae bacterium]
MPEAYVWFVWSLGLLLVWLAVFAFFSTARGRMLRASLLTMLFGLSEPLFVPEYWNPPSLFDLAQKTGFDIESLLFCFALGGIGLVLYDIIFRVEHERMNWTEQHDRHHRFHFWTLISPFIVFSLLYFLTDMNPIYDASISMFIGGLAALWCRPDLKRKIWVSGTIFTLFYFLYFIPLALFMPGYVERVWRLSALSGILLLGVPAEELLFAFTFGMLWSSYYEHLAWYKLKVQSGRE